MSKDFMANQERWKFVLNNQSEPQPHTALARIYYTRRAIEEAKSAPKISFDIGTQHGLLQALEKMSDLKTALTSLLAFLDITPGTTQYRRPKEASLRREALTEINKYYQTVHLIINALNQRYADSLDEDGRKQTNRGTSLRQKVAALLAAFTIAPSMLQETFALPENGGIIQTSDEENDFENFSLNSTVETVSRYLSALEDLIVDLDLGSKVDALRTRIENSNQQDTPTASAEENPVPSAIGTPEGPNYVIVNSTQNVNVRAGAGTDTIRIGTVSNGTTLQIDQSRTAVNGWIPILFNGQNGYISENLVIIQETLPTASPVEANPTQAPSPAAIPPTQESTQTSNVESESPTVEAVESIEAVATPNYTNTPEHIRTNSNWHYNPQFDAFETVIEDDQTESIIRYYAEMGENEEQGMMREVARISGDNWIIIFNVNDLNPNFSNMRFLNELETSTLASAIQELFPNLGDTVRTFVVNISDVNVSRFATPEEISNSAPNLDVRPFMQNLMARGIDFNPQTGFLRMNLSINPNGRSGREDIIMGGVFATLREQNSGGFSDFVSPSLLTNAFGDYRSLLETLYPGSDIEEWQDYPQIFTF